MSSASNTANPKYNPSQTTPFVVKIELMNKETDGSGKHFGFLKLTTNPFPEGHKKNGNYRVHVSLDVSGSMMEQGRLALAKETIAKMVEFLASASKENPDLHFWLTLTTFSNEAEIFIDNAKVSEESASKLTSTVEKLCTKQATNFEASFKLDREVMEKQAAADQEAGNAVTTLHIVMTDGEITFGNTNEDELKGMLLADVEHVFIGYGAGHKACCLMNLASVNDKSSYLFLDHPTKMGAMFAQIFCPHLFTSVSDVEIVLTGAKFLDIESGLEVSTLALKRIAADTTKTFHILTDPDAVHHNADGDEEKYGVTAISVSMQFRSFDNANLDEPPNYPFQTSVPVVSATTHSLDVQKEFKRWEVLVLMSDAKTLKSREQTHQHMMATSHWSQRDPKQNGFKEEKNALIRRATELKDEIREFAEQNGIADDEMLKDLTTDLVVCICAIPSDEHGLMYINARFRSCNDETPTSVSDLTPLDDHVHDYVNSSGYVCGDDQLFSCGGDNQEALYRKRSGAANAAYDNMTRVMSQEPEQQQHQPQMQPQLQRRRSSYQQQQQQCSDDVSHHGYGYGGYNDDSFSDSSHVVITSNDAVGNCDGHHWPQHQQRDDDCIAMIAMCNDDVPSAAPRHATDSN